MGFSRPGKTTFVPWSHGEFNWRGTLPTTKVQFLTGYINPEGCLADQGQAFWDDMLCSSHEQKFEKKSSRHLVCYGFFARTKLDKVRSNVRVRQKFGQFCYNFRENLRVL